MVFRRACSPPGTGETCGCAKVPVIVYATREPNGTGVSLNSSSRVKEAVPFR